jgi:DNA-binding response OmpR family regulator
MRVLVVEEAARILMLTAAATVGDRVQGLNLGAELLVADRGVVGAEDLLERVWDENADPFTRTVTVTIGRLRRKLGEPDPIDTVVGSGYRLP